MLLQRCGRRNTNIPTAQSPARYTKKMKMYKSLDWRLVIFFSLVCQVCFCQTYTDGNYIAQTGRKFTAPEKTITGNLTIKIKRDSIWWIRDLLITQNGITKSQHSISAGTIKRFNQDYLASVIFIQCDTCPPSWKEPIKEPLDSIYYIEEFKSQVVGLNDNLSIEIQNRISHIIFKVLPTGDLLEFYTLYKKE